MRRIDPSTEAGSAREPRERERLVVTAGAVGIDLARDEVSIVAQEKIALPARDPKARHIFNQYTLRAKDRDGLGAHLKARGIGWAIYYPIPLHLQECFAHLGYGPGDLPAAERAAGEVISIPVFPELTREQIETVVEAVAGYY